MIPKMNVMTGGHGAIPLTTLLRQKKTAFGLYLTIDSEPIANRSVDFFDRDSHELIFSMDTNQQGLAYSSFIPLNSMADLYVTVKGTPKEGVQPFIMDFIKAQFLSDMDDPIFFNVELTKGVNVDAQSDHYLQVQHQGRKVTPDIVYRMRNGVWHEISRKVDLRKELDDKYQEGYQAAVSDLS